MEVLWIEFSSFLKKTPKTATLFWDLHQNVIKENSILKR